MCVGRSATVSRELGKRVSLDAHWSERFLLPLAGEGARRADGGRAKRVPSVLACHGWQPVPGQPNNQVLQQRLPVGLKIDISHWSISLTNAATVS
ncbi:hypothetical protein NC00_05075 [Xanthomonas cannabis pv. phaseoli]|uniref:Uncharacterized protein n=1 Tax=Xanthomonas cannabis pv. phaseoli TaxID=1885902 RepID=A0AB34PC01_9XANT|nr:hypothetical protein NC00_05075 [Xanthomonas cannabis pv. phaseoli]